MQAKHGSTRGSGAGVSQLPHGFAWKSPESQTGTQGVGHSGPQNPHMTGGESLHEGNQKKSEGI